MGGPPLKVKDDPPSDYSRAEPRICQDGPLGRNGERPGTGSPGTRLLAEGSATRRAEIGNLGADMGAFEGRITRWMSVFWIGQIGALLGILFALFRS